MSFDDVPARGAEPAEGCEAATGSCDGRADFFDAGAAQPANAMVATTHTQSTAVRRKIDYSFSGALGLKIFASFASFDTAGCDVAPRSRPRMCSWNAPG